MVMGLLLVVLSGFGVVAGGFEWLRRVMLGYGVGTNS